MAEPAGKLYAVDISDQCTAPLPANVQLVISDGSSIPVPESSVDVAAPSPEGVRDVRLVLIGEIRLGSLRGRPLP